MFRKPHSQITRLGLIAAATTLAIASAAQDVPVQKYRLPNGMTVILHEDHTLPIATINIWYKVGSKDEPPHRSGFAHLFEHLMFMGTNRVPTGMFDKIMEGAGGDNNASTTEDRTNFYSVGPSNLLPTLLWLDADRLEDLAKAMDQKKLDLQRQVVLNERRQNTENAPYGKAYEAINGLMFPEGHPYHTSVIGSREDIEQAAVQNVVDFFHTFYLPNNASLVVAGDFSPALVKPIIAKLFGTIPRGNDIVRKPVPMFDFKSKKVTMVDQVQAAKSILVWHSPAAYQAGDADLQVAASVLSDGLTSRLYERLITKDGLATDVNAGQEQRLLGSLFSIDATASDGVSQEKLENAIWEEMKKLERDGPTQDELARVKSKILFGTLNSLQSLDQKADKLNEYEYFIGEPNSFKKVLAGYQAVTVESVKAALRSYVRRDDCLTLRVIPQTETPAQNPRDTKPAINPPSAYAPAGPSVFRLSNGIQVAYWRRAELPLMTVGMLLTAGGADEDPSAKVGAASAMASMLSQGAGALPASEFSNALDRLGAAFSADAGHESTTVNLSTTAANFAPALKLYADAICRPRFDPKEWARVQRVSVGNLQQVVDDPDEVARQVSMREFFGWDQAYGRPVSGTAASVAHLTLSDLKGDYKSIVSSKRASLFVAGSLSEDVVRSELNKDFGAWTGQGAQFDHQFPLHPGVHVSPDSVGAPRMVSSGNPGLRVVIVDKPGAVQTVVRFIMPGREYSDPDRLSLEAISTILGGSFTTRLNQNLRETHGYTYGAGSGFTFANELGYLVASADVRTDVTGASIDEFLKEFKAIRSGDISEAEVEKASSTMRSGYVQSVSTIQGLVGTAMGLAEHARHFSDLALEMKALKDLNLGHLNQIVNASIPLEQGVLVLVGDKAQILPQLNNPGLSAPVTVKFTP